MQKKGFSLFEVLIVIAVIAILVAVAVPGFASSLDKVNLSSDQANYRGAKMTARNAAAMQSYWDGSGDVEVEDGSVAYYDIVKGGLSSEPMVIGRSAIPYPYDGTNEEVAAGKALKITFEKYNSGLNAILEWVEV